MDLIDFLLVVVCMAVAWWSGFKTAEWFHIRAAMSLFQRLGISQQQLERAQQELTQQLQDELEEDEDTVAITVEQHDGVLYAYAKENGQFLAQAVNREDILKIVTERLKNRKITITPQDGGDLLLKSHTS
jgi:biopolymer transport protein ExbB/TolQ